ncbi:unnamed protein product [Heterobilharzia americana]|nr:unnamed protein product [Heterobilharzia americana]
MDSESEGDALAYRYNMTANEYHQHHYDNARQLSLLKSHISTTSNPLNDEMITDHSRMNQLIIDELNMMKQTSNKNLSNVQLSAGYYNHPLANSFQTQGRLSNYMRFYDFTSFYHNNNDNNSSVNEMTVSGTEDQNSNYPLIHSMSNNSDKLRSEQEIIQSSNPFLSYVVHDQEKSVLNLMSQELVSNVPYSSYTTNPVRLIVPSDSSLLNLNTTGPNESAISLNKQTNPWINYSLNEVDEVGSSKYTINNNSIIPSILTTHSMLNNTSNMTKIHNTTVWSTSHDTKSTIVPFFSQSYPSVNDESSYDDSLSDDDNPDDTITHSNDNQQPKSHHYQQSQILNPSQFNLFQNYVQTPSLSSKSSSFLISHNSLDNFSERLADSSNLNSSVQYIIENEIDNNMKIQNRNQTTNHSHIQRIQSQNPVNFSLISLKQNANQKEINNNSNNTSQLNLNDSFSTCTNDQTFRQWLNDSLTINQSIHCSDNCPIPVLLCPRST